ITQVHWARFRGTIAGTEPTYGTPGGEGGPRYTPPPIISGGGFGTGEGGVVRPGRPAGPGFFPVPVGPGSGSVPGPGAMAGPGTMPGPGFSGPGGEYGAEADIQMTSGQIEVSVYGIASLYEKYAKPGEEAPKTP